MPSRSLQSRSLQLPLICGQRFKEKRESLGWSIEELVEKTTFSKNQVVQIENGLSNAFYSEQVKLNSAHKVAEVLNLSRDIAFEFAHANNNMTNIHPPQNIELPSSGVSKNLKDVLVKDVIVNDTIIGNDGPSHEFEKAKAHIKFQLKILFFSFLFLTLLFVSQTHDLFSTLPSFQPTQENKMNK
jgi:transcriptional regulator with XRE-family HTH domain